MSNILKTLVALCVIALPLSLASCAHTKPPRPGKNFIWVPPRTTPAGEFIPGHWKRTGPVVEGKVWVPARRGPNGRWIPGHWRD